MNPPALIHTPAGGAMVPPPSGASPPHSHHSSELSSFDDFPPSAAASAAMYAAADPALFGHFNGHAAHTTTGHHNGGYPMPSQSPLGSGRLMK